jgi:hypothetical protein
MGAMEGWQQHTAGDESPAYLFVPAFIVHVWDSFGKTDSSELPDKPERRRRFVPGTNLFLAFVRAYPFRTELGKAGAPRLWLDRSGPALYCG